jgi:hypothetical protein
MTSGNHLRPIWSPEEGGQGCEETQLPTMRGLGFTSIVLAAIRC